MPVDPATLPVGAFESDDDVRGQLDRLEHSGQLDIDESLHAQSRNGFLAWAVEKIVAHHGLASLSFVCGEPWNCPGDTLGVLFRTADIDKVVSEIDEMFDRIVANPQEFLAIDGQMGCCAKHLLASIESTQVSLRPMIDDGDAMDSVFNFLRSFQAMCRRARDANKFVVYVQFDG